MSQEDQKCLSSQNTPTVIRDPSQPIKPKIKNTFNVNYIYLIIAGVVLLAALGIMMGVNAKKESSIRAEIGAKGQTGPNW